MLWAMTYSGQLINEFLLRSEKAVCCSCPQGSLCPPNNCSDTPTCASLVCHDEGVNRRVKANTVRVPQNFSSVTSTFVKVST